MEQLTQNALLDMQVMWYKKKLQAFPGRLIITPDHIWFKANKINAAGGLLGSLLASSTKKTKGAIWLDNAISEVTFTKGRSMGKKNYILQVTNPEGESFDFLFDDDLLSKVSEVVKL